MEKDSKYCVSNLIFTFHIYLAIAVIAAVTALVFKFLQIDSTPIKEVRPQTFFLTIHQINVLDTVLREKREALSYVLSTLFGLGIIFASLCFFKEKIAEKLATKKEIYLRSAVIFFAVISLCFVFQLFADVEGMFLLFPRLKEPLNVFFMIILCIAITNIILSYQASDTSRIGVVVKALFVIVALMLSLFIFSFWVFDEYSMSPEDSANLSPVVYPIVQQYLGKELLIDFKSLYGLHPYFLQAFLYIFPKTVFTLSIVLASLFLMSLLALAFFIFKFSQNKLLAIAGFAALIYMQNFSVDGHFPMNGLSFQYEAIRLFFPALLLGFCWFFYQNPSPKKYYFSLIFFSLATIWNLDSGIPAFLALVVMLGYENLKNQFSWKFLTLHLAKSFGILATVWLVLTLFLRLKYGQFPNFSWLVYGQAAAADFGYAMLPIPKKGMWQIVVLIYIIGVIFSIDNFINKKHSAQNSAILLLSVLGIGLFTYFLGRSHASNITHCGYPALLLLIIFADKFCQNLVGRKFIWDSKIPRIDLLILALPLILVSYFSVVLFFEIPINQDVRNQFILTKFPHSVKPYWISELNFVKANIGNSESEVRDDVLMLDLNDYDYSFDLALRTKSPLSSVNLRHMFYQEEIDAVYNLVRSQDKKWVVLVEPHSREVYRILSESELENLKKLLNKHYKISARMPLGENGGVTIFERKSNVK